MEQQSSLANEMPCLVVGQCGVRVHDANSKRCDSQRSKEVRESSWTQALAGGNSNNDFFTTALNGDA